MAAGPSDAIPRGHAAGRSTGFLTLATKNIVVVGGVAANDGGTIENAVCDLQPSIQTANRPMTGGRLATSWIIIENMGREVVAALTGLWAV